jgi:hypothetical protein
VTTSRFTKRGEREMLRIAKQWRAHSTDTPELFLDELLEMVTLLEATPTMGLYFDHVGKRAILRVLLIKSRYHVYYAVDDDEVEIVSIWSAQRPEGPRLGRKR